MRIINKTKNIILAENASVADTIIKRLKGLLGTKGLKTGQGLILKPCNSIHTFFMQYPIDVLFVSKDNRVIKTIPFLKPFRITSICFHAAIVIELPTGTIKSSSTHPNDILFFE